MRTRCLRSLCVSGRLPAPLPRKRSTAPRRDATAPPARRTTSRSRGTIWNPTPDIVIVSEGLGQLGDSIDFVNTLGIEQKTFTQLKMVLRPATKHKFRFEYTPIKVRGGEKSCRSRSCSMASASTSASTWATELKWNAYRFGYEWDFIYRDRGFAGLILEAKYTDVRATLTAATVGVAQFTEARAPIPGHRLHRPRLHRPQHLDHRRVHRVQAARESAAKRRLLREVLRLRHLRHGELHRSLRRAAGLPLVRRLLQGEADTGVNQKDTTSAL
jgi:hypothetical protein